MEDGGNLLSTLGLEGGVIAPWTIVAVFILAIWKGWWVPRSRIVELREDRDSRLADKQREVDAAQTREESWRVAWQAAEERGRLSAEQVQEFLKLSEIMVAFLEALPKIIGGEEAEEGGQRNHAHS